MAPIQKYIWKKNPEVIERIIDGEAVLLNLKSGVYYSLNGPGTAVWLALSEHGTTEGIADSIQRDFSGNRASIGKKVSTLLLELARESLVIKEVSGK